MASAEGGLVPRGVEMGGVSLPQPTKGSGSIFSSPSVVRGRAPPENGFWHILKATGRKKQSLMIQM